MKKKIVTKFSYGEIVPLEYMAKRYNEPIVICPKCNEKGLTTHYLDGTSICHHIAKQDYPLIHWVGFCQWR